MLSRIRRAWIGGPGNKLAESWVLVKLWQGSIEEVVRMVFADVILSCWYAIPSARGFAVCRRGVFAQKLTETNCRTNQPMRHSK